MRRDGEGIEGFLERAEELVACGTYEVEHLKQKQSENKGRAQGLRWRWEWGLNQSTAGSGGIKVTEQRKARYREKVGA